MTLTSRELLQAEKKAALLKRRQRFDRTVKADLASRRLTSADLDAEHTGREMHVSEARDAILGWTWTVALKSGERLTYTTDNIDDAPIYCGEGETRVELVLEGGTTAG